MVARGPFGESAAIPSDYDGQVPEWQRGGLLATVPASSNAPPVVPDPIASTPGNDTGISTVHHTGGET